MRQKISIGLIILALAPASRLFSAEPNQKAAEPKQKAPEPNQKAAEPKQKAPEPNQKAARLDKEIHVTIDYLLYLPTDYDRKNKWPLMLFLHGSGERGSDLNLVKKHGPPKLIDNGKQFPFIVVSPQCPKGRRWQPLELKVLLDEIVNKYNVDQDRIYVTGLSMGGFGTWALAAEYPDRFAAIVPICGGGNATWARRISHLPVWVFHGAKDPAVPVKMSQDMVDALKKNGANVNFTVYPDAGHDSWTATYDNPKLYEWLLQQERRHSGSSGS
jgi:predicted peptidase